MPKNSLQIKTAQKHKSQHGNTHKVPHHLAKRIKGNSPVHLKSGTLFCSLLILLLIAPANLVQAANIDVCVICNNPNKVYQCRFESQPRQVLSLNMKGVQFACIKEIAQYGEHGQCAAVRNQTTECNGEPYVLKETAGLYKPEQPEVTPEAEVTEQPKKKSPPTLVGETEKTYEKTKETVEKSYEKTKETVSKGYEKTETTVKTTVKTVGESISDAASTTYNCLKSFFSNCGN